MVYFCRNVCMYGGFVFRANRRPTFDFSHWGGHYHWDVLLQGDIYVLGEWFICWDENYGLQLTQSISWLLTLIYLLSQGLYMMGFSGSAIDFVRKATESRFKYRSLVCFAFVAAVLLN